MGLAGVTLHKSQTFFGLVPKVPGSRHGTKQSSRATMNKQASSKSRFSHSSPSPSHLPPFWATPHIQHAARREATLHPAANRRPTEVSVVQPSFCADIETLRSVTLLACNSYEGRLAPSVVIDIFYWIEHSLDCGRCAQKLVWPCSCIRVPGGNISLTGRQPVLCCSDGLHTVRYLTAMQSGIHLLKSIRVWLVDATYLTQIHSPSHLGSSLFQRKGQCLITIWIWGIRER